MDKSCAKGKILTKWQKMAKYLHISKKSSTFAAVLRLKGLQEM